MAGCIKGSACKVTFHPVSSRSPATPSPSPALLSQLYEALRSLGHNLSAPRRDPATGAEAETLSRAPSGTSVHRAASGGANMSRASSAASVAGAAAPQAPATAEAFWDALKKVGW